MDKEDVYQEYANIIYRYFITMTNDAQSAEELTQETFYQAFKSIDHFQEDGKATFSTWLCAIAKNVWLQEVNRVRKKHRLVESLSSEHTPVYSMEEQYIQNEDKIHFFQQAQQLSEKKRELLYLRLLGNLSFKDIGSILGETENWARVTFYLAKQQIRKGEQ
ncbi:sigma-70 family RNA polymerase sigma factor [Rossellomorea aquimaris]|uniref:RNA polymerase sigma factor n=1 Tax=Rossellomorea aquimaris TaxID=189382 RepID=UPI001CD249F3|nr:sigma-70 family RNA polymerase sigma factor [Rossellomorea aquimaris]MCA1060449.1 sigma-70 family RNA polymerase sigma factor [Rossellomorea aquimaris]